MGRAVLLIVAGVAGFALLRHHGLDVFRFDEQLLWAALLPAVYILGLAILRD